jgi:hypothetical protein
MDWKEKYALLNGYLQRYRELTKPDVIRNKKDQQKAEETVRNIMMFTEDTIFSYPEIYSLYIDGVTDPTTEAIKRGALTKKTSFSNALGELIVKIEKLV